MKFSQKSNSEKFLSYCMDRRVLNLQIITLVKLVHLIKLNFRWIMRFAKQSCHL